MLKIDVRAKGFDGAARALRSLSPRRNPDSTRNALTRGADELVRSISAHLKGPSPKRLNRRTGRTIAALEQGIDRSGLPDRIEVGTPAELFYLEKFERGSGGRGSRFRPQKPFVKPGIDDAFSELERIFAVAWEEQFRRGQRI